MFYSETLLQKTGPLAKVWLAANVERKLTKGDCLTRNLQKDVETIVDTKQAPLALRLTSHLLLGVVRIYSRKARYLLDDCNEALMKIKLAFRPGNVDLPSSESHKANPAALTLPDTITELDLFAPMPDPDDLLFGPLGGTGLGGFGEDQTTLDWGTSQILPNSIDEKRAGSEPLPLDEDLGLDLGEDVTGLAERSIEVGRRAEPRAELTLYDDEDLGLDLGLDEPTSTTVRPGRDDLVAFGDDDDMPMVGMDIENNNLAALARAEQAQRERESLSPLSELAPDAQEELERTFQLQQEEEADETMIQAQQRAKRRKVLQADVNTELHNSQIRAQQEDRSKILKAPNFLPRDPVLLALMNMQKSGGFVSNILGNGRSMGWAPELRSVLSLEVVRRAGDLKRKRESGLPEIELPEDQTEEGLILPEDEPAFPGAADDDDLPAIPGSDDVPALIQDEGDDFQINSPSGPAFDETTIPAVHPADSGPVSLATKHTVHMLREHFSDAEGQPPSPTSRANKSVLFTDLCPEQRTNRADATKLFFETLVLGTKDAIRVEQTTGEDAVLGGPIRIRAKRGLWGDWAEAGVNTQSQGLSQAVAAGLEEEVEAEV